MWKQFHEVSLHIFFNCNTIKKVIDQGSFQIHLVETLIGYNKAEKSQRPPMCSDESYFGG